MFYRQIPVQTTIFQNQDRNLQHMLAVQTHLSNVVMLVLSQSTKAEGRNPSSTMAAWWMKNKEIEGWETLLHAQQPFCAAVIHLLMISNNSPDLELSTGGLPM
jgi:hypothetical protein